MQRYQNPNSCDINRPNCRYYKQGFCYRGTSCKFPHPLRQDEQQEPSTRECPRLRRHQQHHRNHCIHLHPRASAAIPIRRPTFIKPRINDSSKDSDQELCGICYEIPQLYGLLTECEHVFCMNCMLEWRKSFDTLDQIEQKRKCPICRTYSRFVIASDTFYQKSNDKARIIKEWMQIMKRETCPMYRRCPDGLDCIFWHDSRDFLEQEPRQEQEDDVNDNEEEIWEVPQILSIDEEVTWEAP